MDEAENKTKPLALALFILIGLLLLAAIFSRSFFRPSPTDDSQSTITPTPEEQAGILETLNNSSPFPAGTAAERQRAREELRDTSPPPTGTLEDQERVLNSLR